MRGHEQMLAEDSVIGYPLLYAELLRTVTATALRTFPNSLILRGRVARRPVSLGAARTTDCRCQATSHTLARWAASRGPRHGTVGRGHPLAAPTLQILERADVLPELEPRSLILQRAGRASSARIVNRGGIQLMVGKRVIERS